jgi:hypothetical protein
MNREGPIPPLSLCPFFLGGACWSKEQETVWQRLRKFLEENGARIGMPDDRNFETEAKQSSREHVL